MIYLSVIPPVKGGQRRGSQWPLVSLRAARRPEPIVPEVEWNREAAGSVGTHTVFTIGKHTDTQSRRGQYDILSSLSGRICFLELTAADELHGVMREKLGLRCSAEPLFITLIFAPPPPGGLRRDPGPLAYISSLQLLETPKGCSPWPR